VTGWKSSIITVAETHVFGGGIPSVAARMSATFLLKYSPKPSAARNVEHWPLDYAF